MNLIVFLIRLLTAIFFMLVAVVDIAPAPSKDNPASHPNFVAAAVSLLLSILYLWPLIAEVKHKKLIARMPTKKSFTTKRFISFGRWVTAFCSGIYAIIFSEGLQYSAGILLLPVTAAMMPPLDRLLFAPNREMAVRLNSKATLLKIFPNLAIVIAYFTIGLVLRKTYKDVTVDTEAIISLLTSIALLLLIPIVLLIKKGWKGLSLKPVLLPAAAPQQSFYTPIATPNLANSPRVPDISFHLFLHQLNPGRRQEPPTQHKYYSAKASYARWPLPKEARHFPLSEQTFNLLIRGFEISWLESKEYYRRKSLHRDPANLLRGLITEAETYLKSMQFRLALLGRNRITSTKISMGKFAPDEISKLWKENKKFRSLYQATRWLAETPNKHVFKSFPVMAPHIAEYRAISNVIKHLKHSLSRLPKQEVIKVPEKTINPVQTQAEIINPTQIPDVIPDAISDVAPDVSIDTIPDIVPDVTPDAAPVVFISYSWDSVEHESWIVNLAIKLRENGVDAILDKWDLGALGKPLPHFMETSISRAERVICVMTPNYKKKTEKLTGGVGYEYSIITAEIFADSINTSKFIPLFRRGTPAQAIPIALMGRKYVDMRDDAQFEEKFIHELLRDIHDEPRFKKPAIGKKPRF